MRRRDGSPGGWVPGCRVARGSRPAAAVLDRGGESRTARGRASQRSASLRIVGNPGGAAGTGTRTLSSDEGSRSAAARGARALWLFSGRGRGGVLAVSSPEAKAAESDGGVDGFGPGSGTAAPRARMDGDAFGVAEFFYFYILKKCFLQKYIFGFTIYSFIPLPGGRDLYVIKI